VTKDILPAEELKTGIKPEMRIPSIRSLRKTPEESDNSHHPLVLSGVLTILGGFNAGFYLRIPLSASDIPDQQELNPGPTAGVIRHS